MARPTNNAANTALVALQLAAILTQAASGDRGDQLAAVEGVLSVLALRVPALRNNPTLVANLNKTIEDEIARHSVVEEGH